MQRKKNVETLKVFSVQTATLNHHHESMYKKEKEKMEMQPRANEDWKVNMELECVIF